MIAQLRSWLTAVVVTSVLVTVAQSLIPEGTLRRIASITSGLILLLVLLQPVTKLEIGSLHLDYGKYEEQIAEQQSALQNQRDESLKKLIAQRTEAYILDKAKSLGISCTVTVTTQPDESGTPRPYRVELSCAPSGQLARYLSEEIGIPEERQVWNGTEGTN